MSRLGTRGFEIVTKREQCLCRWTESPNRFISRHDFVARQAASRASNIEASAGTVGEIKGAPSLCSHGTTMAQGLLE